MVEEGQEFRWEALKENVLKQKQELKLQILAGNPTKKMVFLDSHRELKKKKKDFFFSLCLSSVILALIMIAPLLS